MIIHKSYLILTQGQNNGNIIDIVGSIMRVSRKTIYVDELTKAKQTGDIPATQQQEQVEPAELIKLFENDEAFYTRDIMCGKRRCCIAFVEGLVSTEVVNKHIIEPLMHADPPEEGDITDFLLQSIIIADEVGRHTELSTMANAVTEGDTIVFVEGCQCALTFNTKKWSLRAITEPEAEKVIKGPREGFNESLIVNLGLIRRKLNTPDFKTTYRKLGTRTNTTTCLCYLQSLANQAVIDEMNHRLDSISIDSMLSVNYIDEMIRDSPMSMFLTMGTTERPDVVAAKLLEGRVAVLIEGCPCGLTAPFIFIENFQAAEDYYGSFWMTSIGRIMRILGFVFTITVPAIYLALTTIHQEMVPTTLLLAVNSARQQVPMPSVVELIVMLVAFEILREAGARLPAFLGQSLSVVGGIIIGQAAVNARLISAPIVIVVSFAGITGLLVPKLEGPTFILRLLFVFMASTLGLYGLMFGLTGMFLHLAGMRSFGVPYMYGTEPLNMQEFKDTVIRAPWWHMVMRPRHISAKDSVRQAGKKI